LLIIKRLTPHQRPPQGGPPEIGSAFDDLDVQLKWRDYLHAMEEAFSKIERYEKLDLPVESKVTIWERFLTTFAENSPYSSHDEELLQIAGERLSFWKNYTDDAQPRTTTAYIFRITGITIHDARGNIIRSEDEIYSVKVGETLTITVDVNQLPDHIVEAIWTTYNGNVAPTTDLTNTYTAQKTGPDYVIVNVWNADTGDEIEEPINFRVIP